MAEIKLLRTEINSNIYLWSKALSPEGEEKFQAEKIARSFFKDEIPAEFSISGMTDSQASTVWLALKSLVNRTTPGTTPSPSSTEEGSVQKKASDGQIRGIMSILFTRYERDYEKITVALKNYAPATIARLQLKDKQNVYLPNFYKEITFAEADKLIKRFDQIKKSEQRRK